MRRSTQIWLCYLLSGLFGVLLPASLWAQDTPDPIAQQLRQITSQVGQLRALTVKNGQAQQGQGAILKKQLSGIEYSLTQLDTTVAGIGIQNQQQIDAVQAINRKLVLIIGGLCLLLVLVLLLQRRSRQPRIVTHQPGNAAAAALTPVPVQTVTPIANAPDEAPEACAIPEQTATSTTIAAPNKLGATPSIELSQIVATDIQATRSVFLEARKDFMKPVDLDR